MGPEMALGSLLTRDHGAAWPLHGSGGRHDSSDRERGCHQDSHQ
jgi:hypothetical protein